MSGYVFRPSRLKPIPEGATITRGRDNKYYASWTSRGRKYRGEVVGDKVRIVEQTYRANWRTENGDKREVSTGCKSEAAALKFLNDRRSEVEQILAGVITRQALTVAGKSISTINEALTDFAGSKRGDGRTEKHITGTVSMIARTAKSCGWRQLRDMSTGKARQFLTGNKQYSSRTQKAFIVALRDFGAWCVFQKLLIENPFQDLQFKGHQKPVRIRRPLTADEVRRLIAAAKADGVAGKTRAALYHTMSSTGLRWKEARALTIGDVDLKESAITLKHENEKNRKGSILPLNESTRGMLADYITRRLEALTGGNTAFLPAFRDVPLFDTLPLSLAKQFKRDASAGKVDIKDEAGHIVDLHSFRYFFGTELARAGVSMPVLQKVMRHSSPSTTMKYYVHLDKADLLQASEFLPDVSSGTLAHGSGK